MNALSQRLSYEQLPIMGGIEGLRMSEKELLSIANALGVPRENALQIVGHAPGGAMGEGGGISYDSVYGPSSEMLGMLNGYTFSPHRKQGRDLVTDMYAPNGDQIGTYQVQKGQSWFDNFVDAAVPMVVTGGALAGLGSALGVFGGAGGAAGAAGGTSAGAIDAAALGLDGVAAGGAGSVAGGGGLSAGAGLGGAGTIAGGSGLTVGGAGAGGGLVAAGTGGAGAGGSFWSSLGLPASTGGVLGAALPLVGTGLQIGAANSAAGKLQQSTNAANDLQKYMYDTTRADNMPALQARNGALSQIQALLQNPGSITSDPGYQFGLKEGQKTMNNGAAARGMTYSGQQGKALQQFGQDYAGTKLDQSYNRLSNLAGLGQTGAGTIANAGANYAGQVGNNLTAQGSANGAAAIANGNALAGAFNGLSAYGQRQGWWGG